MANPKPRQFAGDFRMWRKASDGTLTPVIPEPTDPYGNQPIETNAFNFGYEAGDEVVIKSKRRDNAYNQTIHSDQQPGATSLSIQLLEMPVAILARVLRGVAASATTASGTVTDEPFTVGEINAPIQLAHRYISSLVVKEGAATLVAGTDYTFDLRRGQVIPTAAGAIDEADELLISYSYAAVDATVIQGGATPIESFYITGDMQDRIGGDNGELTVYEARLGVEDDIDWLSAEPLSPTLTGELILPNGAPAPYTFELYKQAA